ncbi:MAG: HAMP domain-containing histidine kinase, partial [Anaerolineae bacterium]|nr:HAMP domain-containing histidine kinase [Anaerolineae bacterium]
MTNKIDRTRLQAMTLLARQSRQTGIDQDNPGLPSEEKEILSFFATEMLGVHDELIKRTRALEEANHRLQEIDQLKTRLVGDVAHELRGPLASMLIKLDLIEQGKPENQGRYVSEIRQQVHRLSDMIENILDLSRIYMSNPAERFSDISINELVSGVVEQYAPRARSAGLVLEWNPGSFMPATRGEREQLERVFSNLIDNAIKYTPQGSVIVASGWDAESRRVYVDIQDTGLGIAPEDLPQLFSRFHRGRRVEDTTIPGTGLGLAIVKEIVD